MAGMNQTGCCCEPPTCVADTYICCLKGVLSGGFCDGLEFYCVAATYIDFWEEGGTCPIAQGESITNMHGSARGMYWNHAYRADGSGFFAMSLCLPVVDIGWGPRAPIEGNDCPIRMTCKITGRVCSDTREYPVDPYLGTTWEQRFGVNELASDWHTAPVVLEDERYRTLQDMHGTTLWPDPVPTLTITVCEEPLNLQPDPNEFVRIKVGYEHRQAGAASLADGICCLGSADGEETDWFQSRCACTEGDKYCGGEINYKGQPWWRYDPVTDTVRISTGAHYSQAAIWESCCTDEQPTNHTTSLCVPFNGGAWMHYLPETLEHYFLPCFDFPYGVVSPYCAGSISSCDNMVPGSCVATGRFTFENVSSAEDCPGCDGSTLPPPDPADWCASTRLCLQLSEEVVVEDPLPGEEYGYYNRCTIPWIGTNTDGQYEGQCDGPVGSHFEGYFVVVEVFESSEPPGLPADERIYTFNFQIWDADPLELIESWTTTATVVCTSEWKYQYTWISGTYRLNISLGPKCPAILTDPPPPPPPCDPLCWPECVLCPDPLSMSIVVSENTVCCFNGTFALTHDSGANRYYLPAPVGYTAGVCGGIRTFVMTCDSETSVTFTWKYRDEDGNDHDRTDVVSAACSGGSFETAAVEILNFFTPGICNRGGIGKGANVRVVGV